MLVQLDQRGHRMYCEFLPEYGAIPMLVGFGFRDARALSAWVRGKRSRRAIPTEAVVFGSCPLEDEYEHFETIRRAHLWVDQAGEA